MGRSTPLRRIGGNRSFRTLKAGLRDIEHLRRTSTPCASATRLARSEPRTERYSRSQALLAWVRGRLSATGDPGAVAVDYEAGAALPTGIVNMAHYRAGPFDWRRRSWRRSDEPATNDDAAPEGGVLTSALSPSRATSLSPLPNQTVSTYQE